MNQEEVMFYTLYDFVNKCVFRALLNSFMSQVALKLEGRLFYNGGAAVAKERPPYVFSVFGAY